MARKNGNGDRTRPRKRPDGRWEPRLPHTIFHAATLHACCCLMLEAGVNPKAVSLQLDRSSVAFTLQRYARYMPGMGEAAAEAMDEALG